MVKKGKGSFGYLKKQAVKHGLFALGNVMFCAMIFLMGYFFIEKSSAIFTVVSVLGMLPAAKFIVSMILFMRAEKHSCTKELYDEVLSLAGDKKEKLLCGFDFYLTSYDKNFPLNCVLIKKSSLIAFCSYSKTDEQLVKKHLETYMKKNAISNITIKIYKDKNKFLERFAKLCMEEENVDSNEIAMYELILNLSI